MMSEFKIARDRETGRPAATPGAAKTGAWTAASAGARAGGPFSPAGNQRESDWVNKAAENLIDEAVRKFPTASAAKDAIEPELSSYFKRIDGVAARREAVIGILRRIEEQGPESININRAVVGAYLDTLGTAEDYTKEVNSLLRHDWAPEWKDGAVNHGPGKDDARVDESIAAEAFARGIKFDYRFQNPGQSAREKLGDDLVRQFDALRANGMTSPEEQANALRPLYQAAMNNLTHLDQNYLKVHLQATKDQYFDKILYEGRETPEVVEPRRAQYTAVIAKLTGEEVTGRPAEHEGLTTEEIDRKYPRPETE